MFIIINMRESCCDAKSDVGRGGNHRRRWFTRGRTGRRSPEGTLVGGSPRSRDGVDGASLSLRDSVWVEVRKSATKSFGPMSTPAMSRPGLYWMYATVPSVRRFEYT